MPKPSNSTLHWATLWIIYAAILSSGVGSINASSSFRENVGSLLTQLLLPHMAGGFASSLWPVRATAFIAGICFILCTSSRRLWNPQLAKYFFNILFLTSMFAIWIDKSFSIATGVGVLLNFFGFGIILKVVDIGATIIWLLCLVAMNRAISRDTTKPSNSFDDGVLNVLSWVLDKLPSIAIPKQESFPFGIRMFCLALTIGFVATVPANLFDATVYSVIDETGYSFKSKQWILLAIKFLSILPLLCVGAVQDSLGLRRSTLICLTSLGVASVIACVMPRHFLVVIMFSFLLNVLGFALAMISANTLSYWYDKRLGTMQGALGLVPCLGFMISFSSAHISAWLFMGGIFLLVMTPFIYWIQRDRPQEVGRGLDGGELLSLDDGVRVRTGSDSSDERSFIACLSNSTFWAVVVGFTVMSAFLSKAFVDVGSLLSVNGYDRMLVAREFAFFAALGYLLGGVSVDITKISFRSGTVVDNPTQYMLPLSMVSCGFLSMVLWGAWPMFGPLGAYRLFAVGSGLFFGAIGPFWARQFGRMHLGKIRGLLFTITFATNAGLAHLAPVLTNSNWGSISLYVSLVIWVTAAAGIFFAQREPQANVR